MYIWNKEVLPLPSFNFGVDASSATIRTKMDSGKTRQRQKQTQQAKTSTLTFEFTKLEYALFSTLFDNVLNNGADWFEIELPLDGNETLTASTVRFTGGFTSQHLAFENWTITAAIEFDNGASAYDIDIGYIVLYEGFDTADFEQACDDLNLEITHFISEHPIY